MRPLFQDSAYPLSDSKPKFIGELIQRFNIRKGKAAKPYRENISEIKEKIVTQFVPAIAKFGMVFKEEMYKEANISNDFCLSEISDFQGLLPKSHNAGVPVFALEDEEIGETGPVLKGMKDNRDKFKVEFGNLADQILTICKYAKSI